MPSHSTAQPHHRHTSRTPLCLHRVNMSMQRDLSHEEAGRFSARVRAMEGNGERNKDKRRAVCSSRSSGISSSQSELSGRTSSNRKLTGKDIKTLREAKLKEEKATENDWITSLHPSSHIADNGINSKKSQPKSQHSDNPKKDSGRDSTDSADRKPPLSSVRKSPAVNVREMRMQREAERLEKIRRQKEMETNWSTSLRDEAQADNYAWVDIDEQNTGKKTKEKFSGREWKERRMKEQRERKAKQQELDTQWTNSLRSDFEDSGNEGSGFSLKQPSQPHKATKPKPVALGRTYIQIAKDRQKKKEEREAVEDSWRSMLRNSTHDTDTQLKVGPPSKKPEKKKGISGKEYRTMREAKQNTEKELIETWKTSLRPGLQSEA